MWFGMLDDHERMLAREEKKRMRFGMLADHERIFAGWAKKACGAVC